MRKLISAFLFLALPALAAQTPAPPADLTAPPADAVKRDDGLVMKRLAEGSGTQHPTAEDIARVRVTVWNSDGTLVQNVAAPNSIVVPMTKMLPGWAEAVQSMVVGEKSRAWVPASLGGGKIAEGKSMVFDTELVEIVERPAAPPDVAAPPQDAKKTESGLAYKVLHAGSGTVHPKRSSTVTVHYTGWTTDGHMFDSSVMRGTPAEFPVDGVIKGWKEGLQLMVVGEKTRFWIPSNLAYGDKKPGVPHGMLVFDVELLGIK